MKKIKFISINLKFEKNISEILNCSQRKISFSNSIIKNYIFQIKNQKI